MKQKANYGIDAPGVIRNLVVSGVFCTIPAVLLGAFMKGVAVRVFAILLIVSAISLLLTALFMILSSKWGKIHERDRVLDVLDVTGNENILDVGCGRGLYLIGIAKRLFSGNATGIDIWQGEDLSGNQVHNVLNNAMAEGVSERVKTETADMRSIPFDSNTFDIVLSSFAIHNIYDRSEREKALLEIVRVLKPGGKVCIIDM